MTNKEFAQEYCEMTGYKEDVMLFEDPEFEGALIGFTEDFIAVYEYDMMVEALAEEYNMTFEEAEDTINYDILSAYAGEKTPIVIHLRDEYEIRRVKRKFKYNPILYKFHLLKLRMKKNKK